MYYGDELGMQDVPIPPDRIQDPFEKNVPGLGLGRDPERTPMQWSAELNAGFTRGEPWLPVAEDYKTRNVEAQREDSRSMLTLTRRLLELRRREPALNVGSYVAVPTQGSLLAYRRREGDSRFLVVLNFAGEPATFDGRHCTPAGSVAVSTHLDRRDETCDDRIELRANEGLVILLES
jgi:alpha-glucosidase